MEKFDLDGHNLGTLGHSHLAGCALYLSCSPTLSTSPNSYVISWKIIPPPTPNRQNTEIVCRTHPADCNYDLP
ncbi:hypothetical protein DESC_60008 [Desulfosarcina cetonica]|nr:hypothetical protein DESC_60008 [Desulfosarcina cetonica]